MRNKTEIGFYTSLVLALLIALTQSGCGFYVGIDYTGKTDKSFTSESPSYRGNK